MENKLKIAWFTFSCCGDSLIVFLELLNDHYMSWKRQIEFKAFKALQKKKDLNDIDVVFIEGAITSKTQEDELIEIRKKAKKLVAVGACAVSGMPSSQRNTFDQKTKDEINPILLRFQYSKMVKKVEEVVSVDEKVPGCPMDESTFLRVLDNYLKEFKITNQ